MSVDELPYCGQCGLSHEGEHDPSEFCEFHRDQLMLFDPSNEEGYCRLCDAGEVRRIYAEG